MFEAAPATWKRRSLGSLMDFINGYPFDPKDWRETGTPIVRIQNLNGSKLFNFYPGEVPDKYHVHSGDLLFCWSGSRGTSFGPRRWDGPVGFLNQHIFRCVLKKDIDPSFAFFLLREMTSKIEKEAHGGGGLVHIKKSDLVLFETKLPPLEEQQKIAEVLQSIDQAIAIAENVADQHSELWEVFAEDMLWQPALRSKNGVVPLGKFIRSSDYGVNASLFDEPCGIAVLRMGNIQKGQIDPTNLKWGEIAEAEVRSLKLRDGDILFNRTNSRNLVGKVALVRGDPDYLYASYLVRLSIDRTVADPYFIFAALHSRRGQTAARTIATPGVSQSNINPTNLKKLLFPSYALDRQKEVATLLRDIETAWLEARLEVGRLCDVRIAVSSQLINGSARVPE